MVHAIQLCPREKVPYLGICLGMQTMVIEFARNVCRPGRRPLHEFDVSTPHPVIALITEWITGRLGACTDELRRAEPCGWARSPAFWRTEAWPGDL